MKTLLPTVKETTPWLKDGATPNTGNDASRTLNGEAVEVGKNMVPQPAQSPYFNVNDVGFSHLSSLGFWKEGFDTFDYIVVGET